MTDKLVITSSEAEAVEVPVSTEPQPIKLPRPIPIWAKLTMLPLILVLPLLCLLTIVVRMAMRAAAPRMRDAWNSYLNSLLVASGLLTTALGVLLFFTFPAPPQAFSAGMSDLDERTGFPTLPSVKEMTGVQLAETLKPLVMVASPMAKRWFLGGDTLSGLTGAALLLHADKDGYLFATARHVADGMSWRSGTGSGKVLLSSGMGGWSSAEVVARHHDEDVALLWVPRRSGHGGFHQPLVTEGVPGSNVFVIGHPEGLNFSVATGIVSRIAGDIVQISAPVSPGNSGGPVYDERGGLLGVVVAKMDRARDPNAENLNFAVRSGVFMRPDEWDFKQNGRQRLENYLKEVVADKIKEEDKK